MAVGRKTGGRKPGTPNKASGAAKELALVYGPAAIKKAAEMAGLVTGKDAATAEAVQMTALNTILDRAYGKAVQPVQHELDLSNLSDEQITALAIALGAPADLGQGLGGDSEAPTAH